MTEAKEKTTAQSPCETCERLFDFNPCSFAKGGKPPEGAEYTEKEIRVFSYEGSKKDVLYSITACPEYEREKQRTADEMHSNGCVDLLAAMVEQAYKDYADDLKAVKTAELQAANWDRKATLLRRDIKHIEGFIPAHSQYQLARIRTVTSAIAPSGPVTKTPCPDDTHEDLIKRAEKAEMLNAIGADKIMRLEKCNADLLRLIKTGKVLCHICRDKKTPYEMGCDRNCARCTDKCTCGNCDQYDKFEYGG